MEILMQYIDARLIVIALFLYTTGLFLKKAPNIKDWSIPLILWVLGIATTIAYIMFIFGDAFSGAIIVSGIIQGTFLAAIAVFANETIKQSLQKRLEDKNE